MNIPNSIYTHNIQCVLLRQVIEPVIFWAKFYNFISISATRGKKKPGTEKKQTKNSKYMEVVWNNECANLDKMRVIQDGKTEFIMAITTDLVELESNYRVSLSIIHSNMR